MRGNSGFIWRWLIVRSLKEISMSSSLLRSSTSSSIQNSSRLRHCTVLLVIFLCGLFSSTYAGPVYTRHRRMMREVFSDLSIELQNSTQPDGKCLLDGLQVPQASIVCERKNGCREIQKTGYCCPDYHCECERDGRIYENGAKLAVDPGRPCTVCYCQGGKILCNSVTCYNRNDCEPKYIQGRCCPEYDNCPPLDELPSSTSTKPNSNQHKLVPSLGVKIKEITKPEEIRIVDDKPKLSYPTLKPNGSSSSNQTKAFQVEQMSSTSTAQNLTVEGLSGSEISSEIKLDKNISTLENTNVNDTTSAEVPQQGEEVVIIDRNGLTKPILILGVEGLQRGDTIDDPVHVNEKMDEIVDKNSGKENSSIFVSHSDLEPEVAGSEINIHVSKDTVSSSTPKEIYETILYTSGPETSDENEATRTVFETVYHQQNEMSNMSTENPSSILSEVPSSNEHHHLHLEDDDTTPIESNPAYPTIPDDDLSIYRREVLEDSDDYLENNHKSKSALQTEKFTTEGPEYSSVNPKYGQERAPGEPFLVPEWERNSTESTNHNRTNSSDQLYQVVIEVDPGSGSEFDQILQRTSSPQPKNIIDVDDRIEASADGTPTTITLSSDTSHENVAESIHNNETDSSAEQLYQVVIDVDPGSGSGLDQILEGTSSPQPKNIIDIDDRIEASADGTPMTVALSTDTSHDNVPEERAFSSIFDPDNQLTNMKFQKVVEAFHHFRKSYLNINV